MFSKDDGTVIRRPFSSVDANRDIVLAPNRTFEIVLPSNPTTGYDWMVHVDHPEVVRNVSHKFTADSSGRVGLGGNTKWSLRTKKSGKTKLVFSYMRPWEEGVEPTRVVTFSIAVR